MPSVFSRADQGTLAPGRLISSAKSWLCHSGVDRTAPLLPWQGAADVKNFRRSRSARVYLAHVARPHGTRSFRIIRWAEQDSC